MSKKVVFSNQHSSLSDIDDYFQKSKEALRNYYNPLRTDKTFIDRFRVFCADEIRQELKGQLETLDKMCAFEVLSAIEARLRIDYLMRCQEKKKDGLSRKFRVIYGQKRNKASLQDDIMKAWKGEGRKNKTRMDGFGDMLKYRHWIAHGRYWHPKNISIYDYDSVRELALDIFEYMELYE